MRMEKNTMQKLIKPGVLILDEVHFKARNIIEDKGEYNGFLIIKVSIHCEGLTIAYVYVPDNI